MEVFGADLNGIDGQLVRFTVTKDENRSGVAVLGLAQRVVKEGLVRASKAIDTLQGDWSRILQGHGYTIDLAPAETPKTSAGLDLPIAIMLLQGSILGSQEHLDAEIQELEKKIAGEKNPKMRDDRRQRLIDTLKEKTQQRELMARYRKRLAGNDARYLLVAKLDITSGRLETPEFGMFGMLAAAESGTTLIVPEDSEALAVVAASSKPNTTAIVAKDLQEVWNVILGVQPARKARKSAIRLAEKKTHGYIPDLREIDGVAKAKRAVMVGLAGGHNILLIGPPGQGKTMLAKAASELLPKLNESEVFELNKIYSAKGELKKNEIIAYRPYREAQSSGITPVALFGGGSPLIRPGEVSMAHRGLLLFDEINLCPQPLIQQLRTVLNDRVQKIQRNLATIEFPCNFIFFAAMNPCHCGWYGHHVCPECGQIFTVKDSKCKAHPGRALVSKCTCSRSQVTTYLHRLSRPILDRIDLKVMVSPYDSGPIDPLENASVTVKKRIGAARELQRQRYAQQQYIECNGDIQNRDVFFRVTPSLPEATQNFFQGITRRIDSRRVQDKLLYVARTVADLDESTAVRVKDIKQSMELMGLNDPYFLNLH